MVRSLWTAASGMNAQQTNVDTIANNLANAVTKMWSSEIKEAEYCKNARVHALIDHDRKANYEQTLKVYEEICGAAGV